jgi:sporulation protein YqfC
VVEYSFDRREKMDKRKEALTKVMAEFLEIPKDLILDLPKITIIGRNEVYLENHRGIIEYLPNRLRINLTRGFLEIEGRDLEIKALMADEISIYGQVNSVRYHD